MRATIKQIAEKSGLSVPTVSRILSDKGHAHQETTVSRVLKVAQELGYRPNSSARAMRRGRFDNIALLQSSTDQSRSMLPSGLIAGIQSATLDQGLRLSFAALPDISLTNARYIPQILREWVADGLLINYNAAIPEPMVALIQEFAIPAIWINSQQSSDCIFPDDELAAWTATGHLLELGHTEIAYVDFQCSGHFSARARRSGYERMMTVAGLPTRSVMAYFDRLQLSEVGQLVLDSLNGRWPTAVVAYAPETVRLLVIAALSRGIRIPEDLSLMTFAVSEEESMRAPIDSMILPQEEMGRLAVEMLVSKVANPDLRLDARSVPFTRRVGWSTAPPKSVRNR